MATPREDVRTQELNLIFDSLGEQGKEDKVWKDYTENMLCYLFQLLLGFLSKIGLENCISLRPYGSAIEDSRIIAPDDVGDVDIVLTSKSEDVFIHDKMIEYLPQHPLHVRVIGRDHPLLQSCLVENTPFIATSAVKNLHPKIFGASAPQVISYVNHFCQTVTREKWGQIVDAELKNEEACPAHQLSYTQSFGHISGEMERLENLPDLDPAEWEWFFHSLLSASGLEYTTEMAEILDESIKFANDLTMSWDVKSRLCQPQVLPGLLQEIIFSERGKQLRARVLDIQKRRHETETSGDCLAEAEEHSGVTPVNRDGNETEMEKEKVLQGTLEFGSGSLLTLENVCDIQKTTEDLGPTSSQLTKEELSELRKEQPSQPAMSKEVSETDLKEEKEKRQNEDPDGRKSETNREQQPYADKKEEHNGVTSGKRDGNETEVKERKVFQGALESSNGSLPNFENVYDSPNTTEELRPTWSQPTTEELSELSNQQLSQHAVSQEVSGTGLNEDKDGRRNEGSDDRQNEANRKQQPLAEKGESSHPVKSLSGGTNFFIEHLLAPVSHGEERMAPWKERVVEETEKTPITGGVDLVPALKCPEWPQVARDWIKQERKWPSPNVIDKVVQEGFHLVVKPPKIGGNPKCDFRISFSHAEYLLSQEMNEIQRECYRCLKKFHRAYLSQDPKCLVTFHLKNLLLQTIEETGTEVWTESNRVNCVLKLFTNLLQALTKQELPHFFVRSYNLFGVDYVENPQILETLAKKVEGILENPMQYAKELIQKESLAKQAQLEKEKSIVRSKPTSKEESEQGYGAKKEETPLGESRVVSTGLAGKGDNRPVCTTAPSYRFHDLKDVYLATSRELISLAFDADDHAIEALESFEISLVFDIREIIEKHNTSYVELVKMFEQFWDAIFLKVWMSREPNMRQRMLDAIRGVVETIKYLVRQEDFALENAEALAERLSNPDPGDPFDLSNLIPAGIMTDVFTRFTNSFTPSTDQTKEEDIPLD